MANLSWIGVYPALLTPFKHIEEIDLDLFALNMKAQIEAGVDGIVIGGSLGEASTLQNSEKNQLALYAKKICGSHLPVIVNIAE